MCKTSSVGRLSLVKEIPRRELKMMKIVLESALHKQRKGKPERKSLSRTHYAITDMLLNNCNKN